MNALPSKSEVRKLFPGYRVSITEKEMNVSVGRLQLQNVSTLVITAIISKTETYATDRRYTNHPVEMETSCDGLRVVKAAGYNAFNSIHGLTVIPSDVERKPY
jgi:hypothetical protein